MSGIPKGWHHRQFDEIATVQAGLVSPLEEPYRFHYHIGGENITSGGGLLRPLKTCDEIGLTSGKYRFGPGAIVYSKIRPNLNKVCLVDFEGVCSADAYPIYGKLDAINPLFLLYWMRSPRFLQQAIASSVRSGMPKINREDLGRIEFLIPPLPEQRKIADILSTWDEALEKLDALIAAKERRKQALMQQLLTGMKRVKGATGKWKRVQLGDVAENMSEQNKGRMGTKSLYGVTKADGIVPMRDHVKGASFARCKMVETHWYAYNPMRINIGSIARWQGAETVMVSGDYVVFRCNEKLLSPAYLDHLRQTWMWQSFVTRGGNGSVRIRIYFSDLAEFTFPCPPIEEQQKIAAVLDAADQELTLLRKQRHALDQQKRGLMQRLLTGKIRIKL